VIRWINNYIGTAPYEKVIESDDVKIIDVRDLVDKPGNTYEIIKEKIFASVNSLEHGKRIIVCCDYGISRSNAVAAGIIKQKEGISFDEAVNRVLLSTGEKDIKLEVLNVVRKAVEKWDDISIERRNGILITGSTGFIGSSLLKSLKTDFTIFTPTRKDIDLITDLIQLDGYIKSNSIDTVIHLANPRVYTSNDTMGTTLVMLKNILDICRENNVKIIYPSSWEVYSGYKSAFLIADEHLPVNPKGTYGETKYFSEKLISIYVKNYGINAKILRISPVYGGDSDKPKFIYNFLNKALMNEKIITHEYSNGYPVLDLININDVVNAFKKILNSKITGVVNIGTGIGCSTKDIAYAIKECVGSSSIVEHVKIDSYTPNIVMNTKKANEVLGWQPRYKIEEWLDYYIKEMIKNE
jgi:UDP-glucuronate decarboxylase